jgi:hypothetical protein
VCVLLFHFPDYLLAHHQNPAAHVFSPAELSLADDLSLLTLISRVWRLVSFFLLEQ